MVDRTSQFYAILTNVGAAKQANADALGIAWKITEMAVGDGNPGNVESPALPQPSANWTALLNEWRRAPLNQLKVDDKDSSIIVAEQIIPADIGGRWIREIGLYDADGDLVAVANCAPTYKPLLNQGSGRTQVVRMNLIVSSASNVQLKIDPSVVLATREWVESELAKQDFKHSVVAATTAAISLSGLQTVDGVALSAGVRVLVKNQVAAKDNGLYLVVAGGAWARCTDANISAEMTPGMLVLVERGAVNGDSAWQLVTDAPITLGVTSLTFEMAFGRTGVAAGIYRSVTVDAYGRVVAASNPTTVGGYGLTDVYTKTQIDETLGLKAPLDSPTFTNNPTAPTQAVGDNSTRLANTAFVQAAIAALVASSPGALDTLNELAAALGNDPNFATTMTNALALKAPLASPMFTGDPRAPTQTASDNDSSVATTAFVRAAMSLFGVGSAANQFGGNIDMLNLTGFYLVSGNAGTMPKWPSGYPGGVQGQSITAGSLLHIERGSGNAATQILDVFISTTTPLTFIRTKNLSGNWLPWGELWTSHNTPKQASSTDQTAGAMLTVGSFGLGAGVLSTETNLNNYKIPGNYLTPLSGLTNLPDGWTASARYNVVVEGLNANNYLIQRITGGLAQGGIPVMALRVMQNVDGWTDWYTYSTSQTLPFRGTQVYKAAGVSTWAVPAGVNKAWVTVIGAGGGGGCAPANSIGSAGGGGGGMSQRLVDLAGVTSVTVTVGEGGAGATSFGGQGGTGGTSSFGAYLSATGGVGGAGNSSSANAGGNGGLGVGGDFNTTLGPGHSNYGTQGGTGGGPGVRASQAAVTGGTGVGPGGGGSGAYTGSSGGLGAVGQVIIQW
ncbi:hypothetical protein E2H86_06630 [Pseudomonas putida]|nr:phage tail protein [Pseudomonas putida]TDJ77965.1 hypothetical protein E2H86_06630 [Pseudomonas putida]